ncbi:MAG: Fructose-1,6-bisphosphatase/inositol-1-monophosphatase [Anaerolineales bacterium]|nr:Fructose-1,6-bisphosphatase/inositol-1-monophosphatase [Anaerolineales bacterium]
MTEDTQVLEALDFAQRLADEVGDRLIEHFGGVREVRLKSDGSLVTQADLEADRMIAGAIRERYPDHDIVSEELDTVYEGAPWCWIIDPIDGTTNFAQGIPVWGVSIALAHEGWPVMGLVDVPPAGTRYHAVKSAGAFENGEPISVAEVDWTDSACLETQLFAACSRTFQNFTTEVPLKPRIVGSAAYDFCLAAAGIAVAAMEVTPKVWDMAAGWLLVREAGGVTVQLEGEPMFPLIPGRDYEAVDYPQLSAPNETIAQELIQRIRRR